MDEAKLKKEQEKLEKKKEDERLLQLMMMNKEIDFKPSIRIIGDGRDPSPEKNLINRNNTKN